MVRSRGGAVAAVVESTAVRRNLPPTLATAVPPPPAAPLAPTPDRCRRPYNSCGGNSHDTRFGGGRRPRRPPPPLPHIGGILRRSGRRLDTDDDKRYRHERFE